MGKKANEFVRRLTEEGIPADEALELIREIEIERAQEGWPTMNPHRFDDKQFQAISDWWFLQRLTATIAQKDAIGMAYLAHALALGEDGAKAFVANDPGMRDEVGLRQNGAKYFKPDLAAFWRKVAAIQPGVFFLTYNPKVVKYLIDRGRFEDIDHFMSQLAPPPASESAVMQMIIDNIHAYK